MRLSLQAFCFQESPSENTGGLFFAQDSRRTHFLTPPLLSYILYNMRKITTRQLVHHTKQVREALERGESLQWTQRGRIVAVLQSPQTATDAPDPVDWLARARSAGAVVQPGKSVSALIDEERGA